MRVKWASILFLVASVFMGRSAQSETITFKHGHPVISEALGIRVTNYDGTQDAYVRRGQAFGGGASNFGGAPVFGVDVDTRLALLRFDISCLESRFTDVHSVTLRLWTQQSPPTGAIDVYRLAAENSAWREGANDGGVCLGCNQHICTWMHLADFGGFPQPSPTWASATGGPDTPGIDYEDVILGVFDNEFAAPDEPFEIEIDVPGSLTDLIADWASVAPTGDGQSPWTPDWNWRQPAPTTANEGFLLRGFEGGTHWVYSSEGPAEFRPELIIELDPAPGAAGSPCERVDMLRGDSNGDGFVGVSDAVTTLLSLFVGHELRCEDAADCDDDGTVAVNDPIVLLSHVYQGGPRPPAPYPNCGTDRIADDLSCDEYSACN